MGCCLRCSLLATCYVYRCLEFHPTSYFKRHTTHKHTTATKTTTTEYIRSINREVEKVEWNNNNNMGVTKTEAKEEAASSTERTQTQTQTHTHAQRGERELKEIRQEEG